ncbi:unnamed protein product [Strongylus vulgaris]|uniref:Uncharacterized protein n=1 Tax=Strongylus vulgaris TaxID=40348 RepID=A0A3P7IUX5_STRVU|nr:unnamed protein product [Strongylus vulgaris]
MGKNLMEEQVLLSAHEFLAHMKSIKNKEAINLRHPIQANINHLNFEENETLTYISSLIVIRYNPKSFVQTCPLMSRIFQKETVFVANIINKTLFGFSYSYNDSDALMANVDQINIIIDGLKESKLILLAQMFPIMYHIPMLGYMARGRLENLVSLLKHKIKEDVENALKGYNTDDEPECFVQAYYQKMQQNKELE